MKHATGMETCADLLFVYFQPSVNKNSQNLAISWRHCENHLYISKLSWNISLSIMGLKSALNS